MQILIYDLRTLDQKTMQASNLLPLKKAHIHTLLWIHRALKQVALDRGVTLETVVNEALEAYLASLGIEQPKAS